MDERPGGERAEFELVGLVDDRFRNACLEWLGCTEEELWSAIAVVGASSTAVREYLRRQRAGRPDPPADTT